MCLETLKDVKEIGGFEVSHFHVEHLATGPSISINHGINGILFRIQNGPIKEVGVNGCQVDTLIEAAKIIIEGLNKNFPCEENECALMCLGSALLWLKERKINREERGVEGFSKA